MYVATFTSDLPDELLLMWLGSAVLDYLKNTIGIISVPAEGLISVLYWGLRAIDPSLLMPPDPKYAIPLVLDLSL